MKKKVFDNFEIFVSFVFSFVNTKENANYVKISKISFFSKNVMFPWIMIIFANPGSSKSIWMCSFDFRCQKLILMHSQLYFDKNDWKPQKVPYNQLFLSYFSIKVSKYGRKSDFFLKLEICKTNLNTSPSQTVCRLDAWLLRKSIFSKNIFFKKIAIFKDFTSAGEYKGKWAKIWKSQKM